MSEEFKVQWSISTPPSAQYAKGDMLNLRGDTVEEVEAIFDVVLAGDFLTKATEVASLLRAAGVVDTVLSPPPPEPIAPEPEPESGGATVTRVCPHGKRVKRTGTNDRGPWTGWFCPLPKGDANQCKVIWD